jgi:fructose-1,6-bisphosphatase/inositol monophosphatase family enzyme
MTKTATVREDQVEEVVLHLHAAGLRLIEAQSGVGWGLKDDGTFITKLDREVQEYLRPHLARIFPDWQLIAEEDPRSFPQSLSATRRAFLDPIDGTAGFARGLGYYGISLALIDERHLPVLAILHLPMLGRWRIAAFEQETPVWYDVASPDAAPLISKCPSPSASLGPFALKNGYLYLSSDTHLRLDLSRYEGKIRALGATAAHLLLLMDGTIDPLAVALTRYKLWDVAAGLALAAGAGFAIWDLASPGTSIGYRDLFQDDATRRLLVAHSDVIGLVASQLEVLKSE